MGTIIMVCGVTVLISLMEKTSGMDLFTSFIARFSTAATVIPLLGGTVGLISAYSSTSAVVLPAFLPTVLASPQSSVSRLLPQLL
jgi:Na+/phosphate symporter